MINDTTLIILATIAYHDYAVFEDSANPVCWEEER
jgi:hypothetical protein